MPNQLADLALRLPTPQDYFQGHVSRSVCIPQNVLLFKRSSTEELLANNFRSYPHNRFVLIFNLETEGTVSIDGINWRLCPGNGLLIFPYQFHHFTNISSSKIVWLFLTFDFENPSALEPFRHRTFNSDTLCEDFLQRVLGRYQTAPNESEKRRLILDSASIINHLLDQLDNDLSKPQDAPIHYEDEMINTIQSFLSQDCDGLESIKKIASELNMSESKLRTSFRKRFNVSLGTYLKNYRSHQAMLLMQNPNMNLTDIAFELGFTTLSAFSRFFSNTTGQSPREYRKSLALSA